MRSTLIAMARYLLLEVFKHLRRKCKGGCRRRHTTTAYRVLNVFYQLVAILYIFTIPSFSVNLNRSRALGSVAAIYNFVFNISTIDDNVLCTFLKT